MKELKRLERSQSRAARVPWGVLSAALLTFAGCNRPSAPLPGTNVTPNTGTASSAPQPVAQPPLQWQQPMQPSGGTVQPGAQTQPSTTLQQPAAAPAVSNAEYEKNLARQSLERAYQNILNRFTKEKMAIVIVNGVGGVEADADHYLERKVFKAAYAEYESGQQRAQQLTEANRKTAEEQAVAQNQGTGPGMMFGPRTVWYQYKRVVSDVPFPEVKGGSFGGGQFVYYVGPIGDLNQLGSKVAVGQVASVDAGSRTVTINSNLPVPVPDIDVEELYIQHGKESVVMMDVTSATGDLDRVTYFLESEVAKLGGENAALTIVGPRPTQPGTYRMFIAPVKNLDEFVARISFGSISDLNPNALSVQIAAKLPSDLPPRPSPAEIAELERKRREGDRNPQDGESEIDWAIRVLKKEETDVYTLEKVVKRLAQLDVDEARQDDVADALIKGINNTWAWHRQDDYLHAMEAWYGKKIEKHFGHLLAESNPKFKKGSILEILAKHPSEENAKAVAGLMTDFFEGKNASKALREMGAAAESTVMKLATDRHASMRIEAYDILTEIGTEKSLSKLKGLVAKEKDKQAKDALKDAIDRLKSRLDDETGGKAAST